MTARAPEVVSWIVPPSCQGQIVDVAYGWDGYGTVYRWVHDRSDGSNTYYSADAADCGCDAECSCFDPANREPSSVFAWQRMVRP